MKVEMRILVYWKGHDRREKVKVQLRIFEPRALCVSMASCPAHNCAYVDALRAFTLVASSSRMAKRSIWIIDVDYRLANGRKHVLRNLNVQEERKAEDSKDPCCRSSVTSLGGCASSANKTKVGAKVQLALSD